SPTHGPTTRPSSLRVTAWLGAPLCEIFSIPAVLEKSARVPFVRRSACGFPKPPAAELFAQLLASSMKHDPKIVLGDVHLRADLAVGALLNFIELEHLRDAMWQLAERQFQVGAELIQLDPMTGGLGLRRDFMQPKDRLVPGLCVVRGFRVVADRAF